MYFVILIILIITLLSYFVINLYLIDTHKLIFTPNVIKYRSSDTDMVYLKKYSTKVKISTLKTGDVFFTKKQWKSTNNNYFKLNESYFIVERNYYYRLNENAKLTINNDSFVFKVKLK